MEDLLRLRVTYNTWSAPYQLGRRPCVWDGRAWWLGGSTRRLLLLYIPLELHLRASSSSFQLL